ncbi:MAG: hypothetical protein ACTSUE_14870 [Promethearchaeota archaeon]
MFPKEMKIRTAANALAIIVAITGICTGISLLDKVTNSNNAIIFASAWFFFAAIHAWIAKYVYQLKKSKLDIPKIIIPAFSIAIMIIEAGMGAWLLINLGIPSDLTPGLLGGLCLGGMALYFIVAKYMWSLKKRNKILEKIVLVAFATMVFAGDIYLMLQGYPKGPLITAIFMNFVIHCVAVALTITAIAAEHKLVKVKYLVFS